MNFIEMAMGRWVRVALLAITAIAWAVTPVDAQSQTLRIAMTAPDIPTTGGIPDNGSEGYRFTGYTIYDLLVNWDLTDPDHAAGLVPGLATEWHVDPQNHLRWIFTLRRGVKFHDGSAFNADAVIWNLDRVFNSKASNYDAFLSAVVRSALPMLDRYEKIDDNHVAIYTKMPFSPFDYVVSRILFCKSCPVRKSRPQLAGLHAAALRHGPLQVDEVYASGLCRAGTQQ